jgi:hypothetical protein
MLVSPLRRTGSQLGCSQLPGNGRIFPLLGEIVDSQVKLLCCRIVAGKVPSILEHFAYLHTQALDSVGRVNGLSDLSWEGEKWDPLVLYPPPTLDNRR